MRRPALALILILLPALGMSAPAPVGGAGKAPVAINLRGAQPARGARPVAPPPPAQSTPLQSPAPSPFVDAAADCRRVCAQDRYFCDAGGADDNCSANWGQCAAACSAPNLARPTLGAAN